MHPILAFVLGAITVLGFAAVLAAAWLGLGDPMDEHWPVGLDEPPMLDVQNHVGDSRRTIYDDAADRLLEQIAEPSPFRWPR